MSFIDEFLDFPAMFEGEFDDSDLGDLILTDEFDDFDLDADDATSLGTILADEDLLVRLHLTSGDAERREVIERLTSLVRQHFPDRGLLHEIQASELTPIERTSILGELIVLAARLECVLGWSYVGGGADRRGSSWELDGANRGVFPSYYQEVVQTHDRRNGARWCTSFYGALAIQAGFDLNSSIRPRVASSIFWSGFRLGKWIRTGSTNRGPRAAQLPDVPVDVPGSMWLDRADLSTLARRLRSVDPGSRIDVLDDFCGSDRRPQPGDVILFPRHTMVVDRMTDDGVVETIEGNAGNAVRSRRLDLTDPEVLTGGDNPKKRRIIAVIRPSADFFAGPPASQPEFGRFPRPGSGASSAPRRLGHTR